MDAELREYLEGMEHRLVERLEGKIDARTQILQIEMNAMEQRLAANINSRKEDIDALGGDILKLQSKTGNLEGRVEVLEARG